MPNKLPWFPHDHDAHHDEFLQKAMDEFGHFGYAAYFMLLELIHKHGTGDRLVMNTSRLAKNLRSRWPQVRLYLEFSRTSGKVEFTLIGTSVELQIHNIRKWWAKQKSKIPRRFPQDSSKIPIEVEVHKERIKDIYTTYGDFVRLTPEHHQKLVARFGATETAERIARLDHYIGSKGKQYKSHYHTILSWAGKDQSIGVATRGHCSKCGFEHDPPLGKDCKRLVL